MELLRAVTSGGIPDRATRLEPPKRDAAPQYGRSQHLAGAPLGDAVAARDAFTRGAGTELGVPCFRYGPERTLPEVRRRALIPGALGAPAAVYVGPLVGGGPDAVSLVYPPGPGRPPSQVTGVAVLVQPIRASATTRTTFRRAPGVPARSRSTRRFARWGVWASPR